MKNEEFHFSNVNDFFFQSRRFNFLEMQQQLT
jgi:hypothetical protein